ncbi:MAG: hypothetical protein PHW74_11605 [Desulfobacca sp.]|nr:hypothetical protein [Desulfobacca sp.]
MHLIRMEFSQIQKFIFRVPRLKAMVGANRQIGLLMQKYLPELVEPHKAAWTPPHDILKIIKHFETIEEKLLGEKLEDMAEHFSKGLLHAAGGHFECLIQDDSPNLGLLQEMFRNLTSQETPGLKILVSGAKLAEGDPFEITDSDLSDDIGKQKYSEVSPEKIAPGFPFRHPCTDIGTEIAIYPWEESPQLPAESKVIRRIGPTVKKLFEAARKTNAQDLGSRIEKIIAKKQYGADEFEFPTEFDDFFYEDKDKYLAIIHADTNKMGELFREFKQKNSLEQKPYLEAAVLAESFYVRNRFCNRLAVIQALLSTNIRLLEKKGKKIIPWRILMLGGDDLLMVMRAWDVFPFLIAYARWYEFLVGAGAGDLGRFGKSPPAVVCRLSPADRDFLQSQSNEKGPLSFKVGTALVPVNFPFVTSHALAEELASEARPLSYQQKVSVGDWALITTANIDALESLRGREHHIPTTAGLLVLRRPRPLLKGSGQGRSLEELWDLAKRIYLSTVSKSGTDPENARVARSKLKMLRSALQQGREETELVCLELLQHLKDSARQLPPEIEEILKNPWQQNHGQWETDLLEIIELVDLAAKYA